MKKYNGSFVIVQDMHHAAALVGGILNLDEKDSRVYYLKKDGTSERFHVHDLEQLLVLQL